MKTTVFQSRDIRSYSLEELQEYFVVNGQKRFRGRQVYQWLWKKGVYSFEKMTNLSKELRDFLSTNFEINHIEVDKMQRSADGTIKSAIKLYDGLFVESVLIPTETRTTACVSSQVGCSLDCNFCATSSLKRMRNLTAQEIYDQVITIDRQSRAYHDKPLRNIVFMGMGEPLMNYNSLVQAIDKITSVDGLNLSPKRITISTSGIPKLIRKMTDDKVGFKLAVSLHSAVEQVRNTIMPFSRKFPLAILREALEYWYHHTKSRITYEYIIWKGVNDKQSDIDALIRFCKYVPCKVNLITYNSIDDSRFIGASSEVTERYVRHLESNGIIATIRRSRGDDIDAACGQLANKSLPRQKQQNKES